MPVLSFGSAARAEQCEGRALGVARLHDPAAARNLHRTVEDRPAIGGEAGDTGVDTGTVM
jgi:hypothetical protein